MNLEQLRTETAPQHRATEALMPLMASELSLPEYTASLRALYSVLAPWETFAASHAPAGLAALVAARRRSPLLAADLYALHAPLPTVEPFDARSIPGLAEGAVPGFLGAMYVVEGSSLGGQYIARHLEATLGLTPANGAAYFRGYGERTGELWSEFKAALAALPNDDGPQVIAAAQAMFAVFARELSTIPRFAAPAR